MGSANSRRDSTTNLGFDAQNQSMNSVFINMQKSPV